MYGYVNKQAWLAARSIECCPLTRINHAYTDSPEGAAGRRAHLFHVHWDGQGDLLQLQGQGPADDGAAVLHLLHLQGGGAVVLRGLPGHGDDLPEEGLTLIGRSIISRKA